MCWIMAHMRMSAGLGFKAEGPGFRVSGVA